MHGGSNQASNLAKPLTTWDSHVKLTTASIQAVTLLRQY
jgi:hypothetical protein